MEPSAWRSRRPVDRHGRLAGNWRVDRAQTSGSKHGGDGVHGTATSMTGGTRRRWRRPPMRVVGSQLALHQRRLCNGFKQLLTGSERHAPGWSCTHVRMRSA